MSKVVIKTTDPVSGETYILAEGEIDEQVVDMGDEYYFMPSCVDREVLAASGKSEKVPDIGERIFYDLVSTGGKQVLKTKVTWVFDTVEDGWEEIAGKYGFQAIDNDGIIVEHEESGEAGPSTSDEAMEDLALT